MENYLLVAVLSVVIYMIYRVEMQIKNLWKKMMAVTTLLGIAITENGTSMTLTVSEESKPPLKKISNLKKRKPDVIDDDELPF